MKITKNNKKIFIATTTGIILLLTATYYLYPNKTNIISECERRGGFWGGTGMCYPWKDLALKKENIIGTKINIPEKNDLFAILSTDNQNSLSGIIKNSKTNETDGEIILHTDKMKNISGEFEFIAPFDVNYKNGEEYSYLGLFSFSKDKRKQGYLFYKNVEHLESYLIDQNIKLGENSVSESGWYDDLYYGASFNYVKQEYFKNGEKKEIMIDVYNDAPYFFLHKTCDEIGQVVTKQRGDGKEYSVCILENGNQCELGNYERRMCPREGYDVSGIDNEAKIYAIINGLGFDKDGTFYFSLEKNDCTVNDYFNGECD
jgi:hypothetical protein